MDLKFCVDCKHFATTRRGEHVCGRLGVVYDLVLGEVLDAASARDERWSSEDYSCGKEAKYWEAKKE